MTIREFLNQASARLKERDVDSPRLSAEVIAGHVLSLTRLDLLLKAEQKLPPQDAERLEAALLRRLAGEPAAMITGGKEFYGRLFALSSHTLVPRPETELMIDAVLSHLDDRAMFFADLGAGSGCIAITLACERLKWRGIMADICPEALKTALINVHRHKAGGRLYPVLADMRAPFTIEAGLDFIVSNPPYVTEEEYAGLSREVRNFEPRAALVSGDDGLEHIRAVAVAAASALKSGGFLFIEHGCAQGQAVRAIFGNPELWREGATLRDFAGHERLCAVRKR